MEAERRISAGTLSLDDVIHVTDEDASEDLGTLSEVPLSADGGISVGNALYYMVTISDNSTAVALLHLFGGGDIDATLTSLGLTGTSVNTTDLPTNAADMARLMEAIYRGDGLTAAARDHALGLLLQQTVRDGVPRGVEGGAAVGNKTGTWDGNTHDIAFVDAPGGPYIIAIMSDEGGWNPVAAVSKAVYEILSKP
jgi:beta-lactamase class A